VWRVLAAPLLEVLRWQVRTVDMHHIGAVSTQVARLDGSAGRAALLMAMPWGMPTGPVARAAARQALDAGVRWAMVTNGVSWRWLDSQRPVGRQHVELHLAAALTDERVWEALWLMGHGDADRLERVVRLTRTLESSATQAVRDAVADVRRRLTQHLEAGDEEVLTHVFRWLFLLFAEARNLLPMHNPVYRQAYAVTTMAWHARRGHAPFSLWDGLRASALLAHTGSRHPLLRVTALNGALFEPGVTPRARHHRLADGVVAPMLEALTTVTRRDRRIPVSFADLGVEHLGTIYEDVLAGRPTLETRTRARPAATPGLVRKQTGTFYTPRDLADHLVAETLSPLVEGRSAEQILALRIVDPAAGSGAILASAARFLLSAVEAAWLRDGQAGPLDLPPGAHADAIRRIVEQCLYGVDVHGRAVQVARLSLWLVSMTRERPLTFLDHHLRVGNSLIGASPAQIVTQRPGRTRAGTRRGQPALFDLDEWDRSAGELALAFADMSSRDSDTAAAVRAKAARFRALHDDETLRRWRRRADLWCGACMHDGGVAEGTWSEVDRLALGRVTTARAAPLSTLAATLERHARDVHCFHWALEFPEIFHGREAPGFDAVLANPPWEMLRADLGSAADRAASRATLSLQQRFVTRSGLYAAGTTGHRNLHQLFVERMLQLCRHEGRIGVIAPWGLMADHASAATRRRLLGRAAADRITVFENRRGIFPIHRSVRFVSVTATTGTATTGLALRTAVDSLDAHPRRTCAATDVWLETALLHAADPDGVSVPCLRSADDLHVLRTLLTKGRPLGAAPWRLAFGRELNASDDRALLAEGVVGNGRLAVVGGRDLRPFGVRTVASGTVIDTAAAARRLPEGRWRYWRLGYRDVAAATNRLSLIAALVPPNVLTTHTVFVLRGPMHLRDQLYLCGVLNSLVANWFVRLYMGTHVTAALMGRLPVPWPADAPSAAREVAWLASRLSRATTGHFEESPQYVRLQATVADLYGLSGRQFAAIVDTFPGLSPAARAGMVTSLVERRARGKARRDGNVNVR
jgi:hypothetical protein